MFKKLCAVLTLGLGLTTGALAQDINFGMISTEATQNLKADSVSYTHLTLPTTPYV